MQRLRIIILAGVLLLSSIIRLHNYNLYPQRGATSDEYTYPFLGVSLFTKHIPISWSAFPEYKHRIDLTVKKLYFPIVWPYFDHPPLYGLLVGGWMLLAGQTAFSKMDLATIRIMPFMLGMGSSLLVFLLSKKFYGFKIAIWALLIFSTATVFVINARVSVAENFITFILLLSLYTLALFKKITYRKIILLGILCGLSFLIKVSGSVVFLSVILLLIQRKVRFSKLFIFFLVFLAIAILFPLYGLYYDWNLFLAIQSEQSHRVIGPETLPYLLFTPIVVNKIVYDGWYIFGFLAVFVASFKEKKNLYITIPFLSYLLLLIISLTKEGQSGWYLIPFFPFMAIAAAVCIGQSIEKNTWFFFVFLLVIGMSEIQMIYEPLFGLNQTIFRVLTGLLIFPPLIVTLLKNQKLAFVVKNIWFYLLILGNIFLTYNYVHPA